MKKILIMAIISLCLILFEVNDVRGATTDFSDVISMIGDFENDSNSDGLGDGWNSTTYVSSKFRSVLTQNVFGGTYSQTLKNNSSGSDSPLLYKDMLMVGSYGDTLYFQYNVKEYNESCKSTTKIELVKYNYGSSTGAEVILSNKITTELQSNEKNMMIEESNDMSFRIVIRLYNSSGLNVNCHVSIDGLFIFNTTDMFGSGKEPHEVPMKTIVTNHISNEKEIYSKLYGELGDIEIDEDSNGLGSYWQTTSQVESTYRSLHQDNVHTGSYAQRLQFRGGNTDNQGMFIDVYNAGNPYDIYYYSYATRARPNYCNSNTQQRVRIYNYETFNSGSTLNSTQIATTKTIKSGTFVTLKANFRFSLTILDSNGIKEDCQIYYDSVQLINLTQMFGKGFEPTATEMDGILANNDSISNVCDNDYTNSYDSVDTSKDVRYVITTQYETEVYLSIAEWEGLTEIDFLEVQFTSGYYLAIEDCPNDTCSWSNNWIGIYVHKIGFPDIIYLNNQKLLNSSSDFVRHVITHELGHSIGLSHSVKNNIMNQHPDGNNVLEPKDMDVACYNKKWDHWEK